MSLIQVARYSDVKYDFKDGYACVPVLEGAFDQARFAHCALQSGHSITPDVYCHVTESVSKRGMEKVRPGKAGKASHIKGNSERA